MNHRASCLVGCAASLALLAGVVGSAPAAVIYVNAGGAFLGDGSSWAQPMLHLSDALAVAQAGDEIWVAAGMYRPDTSGADPSGTNDRSARFVMKSGVAILGGFAGYETSASQRRPEVNVVVLSGDVGVPGNHNDNSYGLVLAENVTNAVLDGFTLMRSKGNDISDSGAALRYSGGGVYIDGGAPTIRNCRFVDCYARWGSGLRIVNGANATVENCAFFRGGDYGQTGGGNVVSIGGGIAMDSSTITLRDSYFEGGWTLYGGAIHANFSSSGVIQRCRFVQNQSVNGGAMSFAGFSNMTVRDCVFVRNEARQLGYFQTTWDGGAVRNWCTGSTFTNCVFIGNKAWGRGGAFFDGGPSGSSGTLINCTIVGNWTRDGGAVNAASGHSTNIRNGILWNNGNGSIAGSTPALYSCVEGLASLTDGNINIDPQFVDPVGPDGLPATGDEDYRLLPTSLCIDAGNDGLVPAGVETDVAGAARFVNVNGGAMSVDMGAYEYAPPPPPPCPGDANGDRLVNFADITSVLQNWGRVIPPGGDGQGDSNHDGTVGFPDITETLIYWGFPCPAGPR